MSNSTAVFWWLRGALAIIVGSAAAWLTNKGLLHLLDRLDVPMTIHYATPQKRLTSIGDFPALNTVTNDTLPAGLAAGWFSLALGWYVAISILRLLPGGLLGRRARWMLTGNAFYALLIGLLLQCELLLLAHLRLWSWLAGVVLLITFFSATAAFMEGWSRLMRWRQVPSADD